MDFNQRMDNLRSNLNRNKAGILTGIGIGGFLYSSYLFCRQTARAVRKIDAKKRELDVEELTLKEKFMLCWRDYIFPFATSAASAALIIKSDNIQTRETGELLSAVMVSRSLLNDYKEAVQETISEKKQEEIEDKATKKNFEKILSDPDLVIYPTGNGNELFIENLTGTVFRSSKIAVVQAISRANERLNKERYISLNEFRYELDLQGHAVGEMLGFDESTNNGVIDYNFSPCEYLGELCWGLTILTEPVTDYDMVYSR